MNDINFQGSENLINSHMIEMAKCMKKEKEKTPNIKINILIMVPHVTKVS